MHSEPPIEICDLSKRYDIFPTPAARVRALLFGRRRDQATFEALKPLSLRIERGQFLGIIGRNGSGKSTLLQLISGILKPTTGTVHVRGRVAALLELGAGFNPEFTGRENARLNAQILGISGREFARLLPTIEAFADIGPFIDRPVKSYSSGMFVRLAFAIQASIEPDILIIDEALAVGDIFFRLKCYERLERLREKGCTVILVTHSMEDIMHYCDKVLLLHRGDVVHFGDPREAVNRYYALGQKATEAVGESAAVAAPAPRPTGDTADVAEDAGAVGQWPEAQMVDVRTRKQVSDGTVTCTRVAITDESNHSKTIFRQFEMMRIWVEFRIDADLETPVAGFVMRSSRGAIVHGRNSGQCASPVPASVRKGEAVRALFEVPLAFGTGEYLVEVGFATWSHDLFLRAARTTMAELESSAARHCVLSEGLPLSVVPRGNFGFEAQPFYGIASVPSNVHVKVLPSV